MLWGRWGSTRDSLALAPRAWARKAFLAKLHLEILTGFGDVEWICINMEYENYIYVIPYVFGFKLIIAYSSISCGIWTLVKQTLTHHNHASIIA